MRYLPYDYYDDYYDEGFIQNTLDALRYKNAQRAELRGSKMLGNDKLYDKGMAKINAASKVKDSLYNTQGVQNMINRQNARSERYAQRQEAKANRKMMNNPVARVAVPMEEDYTLIDILESLDYDDLNYVIGYCESILNNNF